MKKLIEFRGEEALDVLADLIDPCVEIFSDKKLVSLLRGKNKAEAAKVAIRGHKKSILEIMALLDGEDPETYSPRLLDLPVKLLELLNDKELVDLFSLQGQELNKTNSGSASENTEARSD